MVTVNIHEAKTHLSRLIEKAERGETVTIARAGKPVVKLVALEQPDTSRRLGFCADQNWIIPEDFDRWAEDEIREMFEGKE